MTSILAQPTIKIFWITILCFVLPSFLFAQSDHFNVQHYTKGDGLSHREVLSVYQDSLGFIWLGTPYGLNRFDGHDFQWFTKEKNALASNVVSRIFVDTEGLMWLINLEGLYKGRLKYITLFDPYANEVISIESYFPGGLPFNMNEVIAVNGRPGEKLFFYTQTGKLFIYDNQFQQYELNIEGDQYISDILWREDEQVIFVLDRGSQNWVLGVYDIKRNSYQELNLPEAKFIKLIPGHQQVPNAFLTSKKSKKTAGLALAIYTLNTEGELVEIEEHPLLHLNIERLLGSAYSTIYISHDHYWIQFNDNSFSIIDKKTGEILEDLIQHYPDLSFEMDFILDWDGMAWIATQFGLYCLYGKDSKFYTFLTGQKTGEEGLQSVRGITKDDEGYLWVRTELPRALWRIDPETGEELKSDDKKLLGKEGRPMNQFVGYVTKKLKSGRIFVTAGSEFFIKEPAGVSFKIIRTNTYGRNIWAIYEDENGAIWYFDQYQNEIAFLKGTKETVIESKLNPNLHVYVYHVEASQEKDKVWLATDLGLYLFDLKAQKVDKHFYPGGEGPEFFDFEEIYHMYRDNDGTLWLATAHAGMLQVSYSSSGFQVLKQLTLADGLSDNVVYAIYSDQFNNLWVSTNNGISKYDKLSGTFRGFSLSDGLSNDEFNRVSHFQDEDGKIYFGGLNGVTLFDPKDFIGNPANPGKAVELSTIIQVTGKNSTKIDRLPEARKGNALEINPGDKYLSMSFALMDYSGGPKNHYAYKIEGVERDWIYLKDNNLQLSHLPYGRHTLRIKGQNSTGTWSQKELILKLKVNKPIYLKVWFLILASILLISTVSVLFRIRIRALKQMQFKLEKAVDTRTNLIKIQHDKLKKLDASKSMFFTNVSHELRTPLTLILGPINSVLKDINGSNSTNKQLLTMARNSAKQLLKLVNSILDLSKLESGKMNLHEEALNLHAFFNQLYGNFESTAILKRFKYDMYYNFEKDIHVKVDKIKLETVINNLLSNAFKFTDPGGSISLSVDKEGDKLKLSVKDSGKGIAQEDLPRLFNRYYQGLKSDEVAEGGTGIGLALCYELARVLGGAIEVKSVLGEGSEFSLTLPLEEVRVPTGEEAKEDGVKQKIGLAKEEELVKQDDPLHIVKEEGRILVVEDNKALRSYLHLILSAHYKVETAANGLEGLEILKRIAQESNGNGIRNALDKSFDLIISDVMMPVMDGYEFTRQLKSDELWRNIPLLMLTAVANMEGKLKALKIGVDDYLFKPFEEDELLVRIKTLIANYEQRKLFWTKENMVLSNSNSLAEAKKADTENSGPEEWEDWGLLLQRTVMKEMIELEFNTRLLSEKMHLSERQLRRKIKQETGLTPKQYILEVRMQKARHLLENDKVESVKALAYMTGLKDVKNFSKRYKERFGKSPSSYF